MLGFIVFLLLGSQAEGAFPLALHGARAIWDSSAEISYQPNGWISPAHSRVEALNLESGERLPLAVSSSGNGWKLHPGNGWDLSRWIRDPQVLVVSDLSGQELDRTYFQLGALLDEISAFNGCLGICWEGGKPLFRLWAPTARSVSLLWKEGGSLPLQRGEKGVWELAGSSSWKGRSFQYEVEVFVPVTGKMEVFRVTDPYSLALTTNSTHSVVFDPEDPAWMPSGWNAQRRPRLENRGDAVLYELHIREFSGSDPTVPTALRGTYGAFAVKGSAGDRHLKDLAAAGITHIHLMPVQDFSSVEEDSRLRRDPAVPENLPPDSPVPQESLGRVRSLDSFNWGYDPYHFFAPEGSYARHPDGPARLKEFREMVQALHEKGLRVVLDVVFNHTFASGLSKESVLDKIVPGYYQRLNRDGSVANSSCCSDTASERRMMEKLMLDSLESWRKHFGIDGFRFDLMNLHGVGTMKRIRDALRSRDPSLLLYGEAWSFGSLLDSSGDAFVQEKVFGTSIGVFNDRIRDAIRGGTTDTKEKSDQGFVTGLYYDFNHEPANRNTPVDLGAQREKLLFLSDVVRVGMAGNLRDFRFRNFRGDWIRGGELRFNGGPTGFSAQPEETINYVSAHDGYTLFDALQAKLPFHTRWRDPPTATVRERLERQILAVGMVALSQGIPFFDAGSEILRSKSGDQNSYDSGDWFNRLDWSLAANGWGRGLPPAYSNPDDWPFWRPRLADEQLLPGAPEIREMKENFLALLRIRRSSPLFHLRSAREIQERVRFLGAEAGPMQLPGLIAMEILDEEAGADLDRRWKRLLVTVNVTNEAQLFSHDSLRGLALERLYGKAEFRPAEEAQLRLPPRSLTVWGERP